jgi:hypothetical protein
MANKRGRPKKVVEAVMADEVAVKFPTENEIAAHEPNDEFSITELANSFAGLADPGGMYSYPGSFGSNYGLNWNKNITMPTLPGTSKLSTPKPDDFKTQMIWSREIRDVKLIHGPLLRRRKFIVSGFRHKHHDQRIVDLFDTIAKKAKLKQRLKDMAWELQTVGWVVVMPDMVNPIPQDLHLLQDGIENERVFGQDNLFLRMDSLTVEKIRENANHFPAFIVKAVSGPEFNGRLPLQGCYFITAPRSINSPFPRAPIFPLFEPIKVIENLIETQFAISFAIKQLIMHVKVAGQEGPDGIKKPPTMAALKNASRQVFDGARSATIVTPDTVTIEFLSPDKSIFESATLPYEKAMERINKNIGIPMILVDGSAEGISFSTAVYVIKGFLQDIINDREVLLDDFVYPWYEKKAAELYKSDPKKYGFLFNAKTQEYNLPQVMFNETELKNMLELLQILKFKWQTGMYSGQDVTEAFQDDYETIKKRKEDFNADCDFVYLPFEPNQGLARNVEDISTQPNPQLIAPDGKPMDQKDVMEMQTDQQSQLQDQQNKNAQDMQDDQHDKNIEMQGVQHNNQLEMEKTKAKLAPPIPKMPGGVKNQKKPAGSPGRPSTSGAPPRSDSVDRAPRSGAPSARGMNPQARPKSASLGNFNDESSISDIIRMLDSNIEMLKDQLSKDMGENNED